MLAMVAVGILAAHLGGRALWLVPISFVTVMAVGGALGMAGVPLPFVEIGIALSVVALGLAIALQVSLRQRGRRAGPHPPRPGGGGGAPGPPPRGGGAGGGGEAFAAAAAPPPYAAALNDEHENCGDAD